MILGILVLAGHLTALLRELVPALPQMPGQAESNTSLISNVSFGFCGRPPHSDCVIDGDTFYMRSQSIRIADIDAPETHPPRCEYEESLGALATRRLHELLNAGPFALESEPGRDEDQYGRKLRIVVRGGRSLGEILVSEGLAREWTGRRLSWCG